MRKTCLSYVYTLAQQDPRVVFIGSDLGYGVLENFRQNIPERFFMEGVSESHLIGMMAGMALSGKIPYMNTIGTFITRRCYEYIVLEAGLHQVPIRLIGSGGGGVYAPLGPTHLATDDIAILRVIPNMTIVAPCDADEMQRLMPQTLDWPGPIYIRLAKGGDPRISQAHHGFEIGKAIRMKSGQDVLLVSTGIGTQIAMELAKQSVAQGLSVGVLHMHTLKPFDTDALIEAMRPVSVVISIEEHSICGGLGSMVAETLAEANFAQAKRFFRSGYPDVFPDKYGSQKDLLSYYGITVDHIMAKIQELMEVGSYDYSLSTGGGCDSVLEGKKEFS